MTATTTNQRSSELPLILAAIDLFGRDGYAAVSTRALCEQAGTNISSIKYHFGGKEELYKAAVNHVIEQLKPRFDFAMAAFEQGRSLVGDDRDKQAQLIKQLARNLLNFFLGSEDVTHFMPLVMREFFQPGPYFEDFYQALPRHLHELFAEIVAMVDGTDPTDEKTIIRAHSIIGQMMIFHVGRQILFKRLAWQTYSPEGIEVIITEVQTLLLNSLQLEDPDRLNSVGGEHGG